MHYDRLIAALNKHWRKLDEKEFWEDMDFIMTNTAIQAACFPKEIHEWIFEVERKPFEVF